MGFKANDLTPLQITPLTPGAKDVQVKAFRVARTDTTAALKMQLPAGSQILDLNISGVASDAATTATISIGTTTTSTELVSAQDVKGAGTFIRPTTIASGLVTAEALPRGQDISIYAKYAETGTASTVGAWTVLVYFIQ